MQRVSPTGGGGSSRRADTPPQATREHRSGGSGSDRAPERSAPVGAGVSCEPPPAPAVALDSSQINAPAQVRGSNESRRARWRRRHTSARFLRALMAEDPRGPFAKPVRPARCSWTLGHHVPVMYDGTRPAGYGALEKCASIWCCPHCSAVIRAGRAAEIEEAVTAHQKAGKAVVFFTGTVRHHQGDKLETTLGAVLGAWSRLRRNKGWRLMKSEFGITGYIRSIEVTGNFSDDGHGWHPHCHALIFLEKDLTDSELASLQATLFGYWSRAVVAEGGKEPNEKGLDLQKVDKDGKVLAHYLGKLQDKKKWSAGAEIARFDAKKSRGGLVPFELLDDDSDLPEWRRAELWREYYLATKGRRAITWSRGLKQMYVVPEVEDEEILAEAESSVMAWRTTSKTFRELRKVDVELLAIALESVERGDWETVQQLLPADVDFQQHGQQILWWEKKKKKLASPKAS